jgi:hypothetical protein
VEYRRIATFNQGTPQEITWDIFIDFNDNQQYVANAHCLTKTQPCWAITGYTTSILALDSMNSHVVNYIRLIPNATFQVICYPEEANQIVLSVTCLAKSWNIQVVSGTANPQSGTGKNYNDTVLNAWNAIMTY